MTNFRTDDVDGYFGVLGYDTETYTEQYGGMCNTATEKPKKTVESNDDDAGEGDNITPRIPWSTSAPPVHSQDDDSSIMAMGKAMDLLSTLFDNAEQSCVQGLHSYSSAYDSFTKDLALSAEQTRQKFRGMPEKRNSGVRRRRKSLGQRITTFRPFRTWGPNSQPWLFAWGPMYSVSRWMSNRIQRGYKSVHAGVSMQSVSIPE